MTSMSDDTPRASPSPEGAVLISRVYQIAMALKFGRVDAAKARVAVILTMGEAFTLIDHLHNGPWQLEVHTPLRRGENPQTVRFDLATSPRPGMVWATLFGVTLIIDDTDEIRET